MKRRGTVRTLYRNSLPSSIPKTDLTISSASVYSTIFLLGDGLKSVYFIQSTESLRKTEEEKR